jgi:hypothetical protein
MRVLTDSDSGHGQAGFLICLLVLASSAGPSAAQSLESGAAELSPVRSLYLQFGIGIPFLNQPTQFTDGWKPDASVHVGMLYFESAFRSTSSRLPLTTWRL